jgi:hypothetical protein
MMNMMTIFDIDGQGSYAMIEDLVVANNDLTQVAPPVRWTVVNIRQSATASVVSATITNNTNIRHVFSAQDLSTLDVSHAVVMMASGGLAVVSRADLPILFIGIKYLPVSLFFRIRLM